jgi:hypothetical protein
LLGEKFYVGAFHVKMDLHTMSLLKGYRDETGQEELEGQPQGVSW